MASVPCQSHTQKARSRPGSGTGTQCSVISLSVPILCPASSLEKHCVSTLSFLGKLGTNFRTSRRVHGRPGQAGLDRLLRDARSVSRFGRCPCPRRLREGFGAPGLALKRCRPPGKSHRWGRRSVLEHADLTGTHRAATSLGLWVFSVGWTQFP